MSNENVLEQWTIYDRPSDDPGHFVVRRWEIRPNDPRAMEVTARTNTLEEARASLPDGLYCLGRAPTDDPAIVEVWL